MLRAYIEPIETFLESDGPVQDIVNKVKWLHFYLTGVNCWTLTSLVPSSHEYTVYCILYTNTEFSMCKGRQICQCSLIDLGYVKVSYTTMTLVTTLCWWLFRHCRSCHLEFVTNINCLQHQLSHFVAPIFYRSYLEFEFSLPRRAEYQNVSSLLVHQWSYFGCFLDY